MTDGIIQEVFNKYIQLHDCECPDKETNQWNELIITKFIMIQKELIEKIKQTCATSNEKSCFCSRLIGDNQE